MADYVLSVKLDDSQLKKQLDSIAKMLQGGSSGASAKSGGSSSGSSYNAMGNFSSVASLDDKLVRREEKEERKETKEERKKREKYWEKTKDLFTSMDKKQAALTGISFGTGSIIGLLTDSSKILESTFKLLNTGIMLMIKPIGDFIGLVLRPIMVMFMQTFLIPFYQTIYPVFRDYGTQIGRFLTLLVTGDLEAAKLFGKAVQGEDYEPKIADSWDQGFKNWMGNMIGGIEIAEGIADWFANAGTNLEDAWDSFITWTEGLHTRIQTELEKIKTWWAGVVTFFEDPVQTIIDGIQTFWQGVVDFFNDTVKDVIDGIETFWQGIVDFFNDPVQTIIDSIETFWQGVTDFFNDTVQPIIDAISPYWQGVIDSFNNTLQPIINAISPYWQGVIDFFNITLQPIIDAISPYWQGVVDFFNDTVRPIINKIQTFWQGAVDFFTTYVKPIWDKLRAFWQGIVDFANMNIKPIWESIKGWFSDIANSIKPIANIFHDLRNFVSGMFGGGSGGGNWWDNLFPSTPEAYGDTGGSTGTPHDPNAEYFTTGQGQGVYLYNKDGMQGSGLIGSNAMQSLKDAGFVYNKDGSLYSPVAAVQPARGTQNPPNLHPPAGGYASGIADFMRRVGASGYNTGGDTAYGGYEAHKGSTPGTRSQPSTPYVLPELDPNYQDAGTRPAYDMNIGGNVQSGGGVSTSSLGTDGFERDSSGKIIIYTPAGYEYKAWSVEEANSLLARGFTRTPIDATTGGGSGVTNIDSSKVLDLTSGTKRIQQWTHPETGHIVLVDEGSGDWKQYNKKGYKFTGMYSGEESSGSMSSSELTSNMDSTGRYRGDGFQFTGEDGTVYAPDGRVLLSRDDDDPHLISNQPFVKHGGLITHGRYAGMYKEEGSRLVYTEEDWNIMQQEKKDLKYVSDVGQTILDELIKPDNLKTVMLKPFTWIKGGKYHGEKNFWGGGWAHIPTGYTLHSERREKLMTFLNALTGGDSQLTNDILDKIEDTYAKVNAKIDVDAIEALPRSLEYASQGGRSELNDFFKIMGDKSTKTGMRYPKGVKSSIKGLSPIITDMVKSRRKEISDNAQYDVFDRSTKFAEGGMITEPISGIGHRTGKSYLMGEAGNEMVVPMKNAQSASTSGYQRPIIFNVTVTNQPQLDSLISQIKQELKAEYGRAGVI